MNQGSQSLWDYSIALYDREGIAPTCLSLQDQFALDVNLLMFCLWYGEIFGKLTTLQLSEALEISRSWSSVAVTPLRTVRRTIKSDKALAKLPEYEAINSWRESVKKLELDAEKIQQGILEHTVRSNWNQSDTENTGNDENTGSVQSDPGEYNLLLLLSAMNLQLSLPLQDKIQILLQGRRSI